MKKMNLLETINPHIQSMWMAKDMIESIMKNYGDNPKMIQRAIDAALAASRGEPQDVFPPEAVGEHSALVMVANELRRYLEK